MAQAKILDGPWRGADRHPLGRLAQFGNDDILSAKNNPVRNARHLALFDVPQAIAPAVRLGGMLEGVWLRHARSCDEDEPSFLNHFIRPAQSVYLVIMIIVVLAGEVFQLTRE